MEGTAMISVFKKTIWLFVCLLIPVVVSAQTQQGYVKTKGRMVNGQLVAGKGIPSAAVAVRGRSTVLSQENGSFSFSLSAQTFKLDSVSKKGFQLVDADALTKPYKYSSNPLYLVMDTPEQQQADLLAKERKLRRDLQRRLQEREDEVEDLNVSLEEKNRLLEEINKERDDNEKIIKELSKYYATLDYDQLDEFQRKVTDLLENGQLERADSMLRTRGDMQSRIREINQEQETEAKEEAELKQRQKDLAASKEGTQKKLELVAADCYNFYQRFFRAHQNDSAAHYLDLRAQLDTTNLEWQAKVAKFSHEYLADYPKSMKYYQMILRQAIERDGAESEWAALANNGIGYIYNSQGNLSEALKYYNKALDIRLKASGAEHRELAQYYNNIGTVCCNQGNYPKALEYLEKALAIREKTSRQDDPYLATLCCNIGQVYSYQENYAKALEYHEQSLARYEKIYGLEHPDVATTYNNIGTVYSHMGNSTKALEYFNKALTIHEKVLGQEHPSVATSLNNIGQILSQQGDYAKALECFNKALAIREKLFGPEHPSVGTSYNNISDIYYGQEDYQKSLEYYMKALGIWEKVYGKEHPDVAVSYNNIAQLYSDMGDYSKAYEYYEKALVIKEKVFGKEHPSTKYVLNELLIAKYQLTLTSGNLSDFLSNHSFTIEVTENDTPAAQQGMSGEYYLLEYSDWKQDCTTSLFDEMDKRRGKPKDLLVMKDGKVSLHHFENKIGIQYGIKEVGKEEKQRINKVYEAWKKQNRK